MPDKQITYTKDGKTRRIKLSSALSYDKKHPAYKAAQLYLKKQDTSRDSDIVDAEPEVKVNGRLKPLKSQYTVKSNLPEDQVEILNRLLNSQSDKSLTLKDYADKFNVGTIQSATGELLTLSSYTMDDDSWVATYKKLLKHCQQPNCNIDESWVRAANSNRIALQTQLDITYGPGKWGIRNAEWNVSDLKSKHDGIVEIKIGKKTIAQKISLKKDSDSSVWTGGIKDLDLPEILNVTTLKAKQSDVWSKFRDDSTIINDIKNNQSKLIDYADTLKVKQFERNKIKTLINYISKNGSYPFDNTDEMKDWRKIQGFKSNPTEYKRYSTVLAQILSKNKIGQSSSYLKGQKDNFSEFATNFKNEFETDPKLKTQLTKKITNAIGLDKLIKNELSINMGSVPVYKDTMVKILGTEDVNEINSKLQLTKTDSGSIDIVYSVGKNNFIPVATVSLKNSSSGANVNIKFVDSFLCKNLFAHIDLAKQRNKKFNVKEYYNTFSSYDQKKYSKCKRE